MLHEEYPALPQAEPLVKDSFAQTAIPLTNKVSLFATLETISQPVVSVYPQNHGTIRTKYRLSSLPNKH